MYIISGVANSVMFFFGTQKGSTKLRGAANMEMCPYSRKNWKKLLKNLLNIYLEISHVSNIFVTLFNYLF